MKQFLAASAFALALSACTSEPTPAPDAGGNISNAVAPEATAPSPASTPAPTPSASTLTLEGLGALRIGEPVPAGGAWAERGAQASETCRIVSSPDHPGVYAIVEGGRVRRITIGQGSDVRLIEGIGIGAGEAEVRAAFPGFREEPHKYVDAPAKYLTAPNAASGDPALRFETGAEGRVSLIHVGTMPVLGYVEGCS